MSTETIAKGIVMKTGLIVSGIVTVALILLGTMSYVSAHNKGNRLEQGIVAAYERNQNTLAQYGQKVAEAAQIPAMQRDDLAAVVTQALDARYGEDGSQAMFQFIQESNPSIDSAVYTQLQRIIESGRNEFKFNQDALIDKKRVYETALGTFWGGMWLRAAGYPEIDLDEYKIVTTARAQETFQTGVEAPLVLR